MPEITITYTRYLVGFSKLEDSDGVAVSIRTVYEAPLGIPVPPPVQGDEYLVDETALFAANATRRGVETSEEWSEPDLCTVMSCERSPTRPEVLRALAQGAGNVAA